MLKKAAAPELNAAEQTNIKDASFPAPFHAGLEYSSPARGTWNIVHTGMLIPESHEIFVCALGCLRGVVLTAAEMNALDRYSSITITEDQVLSGGMEQLMIDGVSGIIEKLEKRPRAILLFISCQHFFLAYDQQYVFDALSEQFPDIRFIDCYMIPTLRKSGVTPDQKMRMQLYAAWEKPQVRDEKKVNLIGSNLPLFEGAELRTWLSENGICLQQIQDCHIYDEYISMENACLNLYYEPLAKMAADSLKERLGMEAFYLPFSFDEEELSASYLALAEKLNIPAPDFSAEINEARKAIQDAKEALGDTKIALDYTFTFRTLSFAKMLLANGFHLTEIYADAFAADDRKDFEFLREHKPDLVVRPTNRPQMRFVHEPAGERILAIGQKAAYFCGTDHFVNIAESGGLFGFRGLAEIMKLMAEALREKKNRKELIQKKGIGCESCI